MLVVGNLSSSHPLIENEHLNIFFNGLNKIPKAIIKTLKMKDKLYGKICIRAK